MIEKLKKILKKYSGFILVTLGGLTGYTLGINQLSDVGIVSLGGAIGNLYGIHAKKKPKKFIVKCENERCVNNKDGKCNVQYTNTIKLDKNRDCKTFDFE